METNTNNQMPPNMPQTPPMPPQAPPAAPPPPAPTQGSSGNTGMAILAYLGILIIIPFLTEAHKDPYVKFHLKQGLALIIVEVIAMFFLIIPFLGWFIGFIVWICVIILIIVGIINAANGQMKELPIIGSFGNKFNF